MSPRFSYCKPVSKLDPTCNLFSCTFYTVFLLKQPFLMQTTHKDKMFNRRHSLNLPEQLPSHCSRKATERIQKATSKVCCNSSRIISTCWGQYMFFLNQMKYEDAYVICYCSFTSSALSTLLTLISGGDVIVGQDYTLNIVSVFFQEKRF
jgi:hypothetical protein